MADQVTTSLAQAKVLVMEGQKGADGKSPYIGANGNWYVWNGTAWVDTGIPASLDDAQIAAAVEEYLEEHPVEITVDDALSDTSENPVQNKVVDAALNQKGTYSKPSGGIPKSDLAQSVQDALDNADDAYQKPSGGIPKTDLASDVQTSLGKADTALQQHQSLAGYATETWVNQQGFLKQHQDISGKADKVLRVAMTASDITPALNPNTFYVFPEMASLTPTLNTPSDATIVNEYHFIFDSGATATVLTLPATVLQPDGFTVEANMHYEVSILEGAMTAQGWAVSPS